MHPPELFESQDRFFDHMAESIQAHPPRTQEQMECVLHAIVLGVVTINSFYGTIPPSGGIQRFSTVIKKPYGTTTN